MELRPVQWAVVLCCCLIGVGWPRGVARAAGTLACPYSVGQSDFELTLCSYEQGDERVGLLRIQNHDNTVGNTFAFRYSEWLQLIEVSRLAEGSQSASSGWKVTRELHETETTDPSHLVVSAGPAVRFALNSPAGASVTFVLSSADFGRFNDALDGVAAFIKDH